MKGLSYVLNIFSVSAMIKFCLDYLTYTLNETINFVDESNKIEHTH